MRRASGDRYRCDTDDEERDHFWIHMKTMAAGSHKQDVNCHFFCTYGNKPCQTGSGEYRKFLTSPIPMSCPILKSFHKIIQ
jgi:hypothetical protein